MAGNRDRRCPNQIRYTRPSRAQQRSTRFWTVMVSASLCAASGAVRHAAGLVAGTAGRRRHAALCHVLHTQPVPPADLVRRREANQQQTCEFIYRSESSFARTACSNWTSGCNTPVSRQLNERGDAAPWPDRPLVRPIGLAAGNCESQIAVD